MQNYRNDTNDYMRRGNCSRGYRMNNGMAPGSAPSPYSGNRNMNSRSSDQQPYRDTSSCCDRDDVLEGMPLAMAYVPWQNWRKIYEPEKAFCRGTIFEELDKPFQGIGGCQS